MELVDPSAHGGCSVGSVLRAGSKLKLGRPHVDPAQPEGTAQVGKRAASALGHAPRGGTQQPSLAQGLPKTIASLAWLEGMVEVVKRVASVLGSAPQADTLRHRRRRVLQQQIALRVQLGDTVRREVRAASAQVRARPVAMEKQRRRLVSARELARQGGMATKVRWMVSAPGHVPLDGTQKPPLLLVPLRMTASLA